MGRGGWRCASSLDHLKRCVVFAGLFGIARNDGLAGNDLRVLA